jgi:hypothetical protein
MRPIEIKNVKITNWKNGKTILLRKLSDATKILGWSQNDLIHFYPVQRNFIKNYIFYSFLIFLKIVRNFFVIRVFNIYGSLLND